MVPPLSDLISLARSAGRAVMDVYAADEIELTHKHDDSPLTRADLASHTLITTGLEKLRTGIPIISEESDDHDQDRLQHDKIWLIDPLDGTKEFLKRNGQFTVNIALIEKGRPLIGVVHAPALDTTYWNDSTGAFRQRGSSPASRIHVRDIPRAPVAVVSGSHPSREVVSWLRGRRINETVAVGSSLKLCYVAEGAADVYPRLAPTMEWDTAAGEAVLSAAGGTVRQYPKHQPMRYNKPDLTNPFFIAASDPSLTS